MNSSDPLRGDAELVFGVVLLAAGASQRMGRPKLLLPWKDSTVVGHLLTNWRQLHPRQILIVMAPQDQALSAELDRAPSSGPVGRWDRVVNPDPTQGMFSSIQVAARWPGWRPEIQHWLISLGDQPHVRPETWRRVLAEGTAHPDSICQPARHGRPRHPVLLPAGIFRELATATEEHFKQFLAARAERRHCWESDDTGLDLDLDFPADYEKACRLAATLEAEKTSGGTSMKAWA
jgi:molybdenum cofactor cytidylyltransferase